MLSHRNDDSSTRNTETRLSGSCEVSEEESYGFLRIRLTLTSSVDVATEAVIFDRKKKQSDSINILRTCSQL